MLDPLGPLVVLLTGLLVVWVFNETISMFIAGVVTIVVFLASYYYLFIYREKSGDKEIWKGKLT